LAAKKGWCVIHKTCWLLEISFISSTKENRDLPLKPLSISSKKKVLGFLEILDLIANKNLGISPPEITFDNGASFWSGLAENKKFISSIPSPEGLQSENWIEKFAFSNPRFLKMEITEFCNCSAIAFLSVDWVKNKEFKLFCKFLIWF